MDFEFTGGEVSDIKIAPEVVARKQMKKLLADKAYHSQAFREELSRRRIEACIPLKSNTKAEIKFDKMLYRLCQVTENIFSRIKNWRGIAFRTHRNASPFQGGVCMALISLFL